MTFCVKIFSLKLTYYFYFIGAIYVPNGVVIGAAVDAVVEYVADPGTGTHVGGRFVCGVVIIYMFVK